MKFKVGDKVRDLSEDQLGIGTVTSVDVGWPYPITVKFETSNVENDTKWIQYQYTKDGFFMFDDEYPSIELVNENETEENKTEENTNEENQPKKVTLELKPNNAVFEIIRGVNGFVVKEYTEDGEEYLVSQDNERNEASGFVDFLRTLKERFGPSTSRYSRERVYSHCLPGDNYEGPVTQEMKDEASFLLSLCENVLNSPTEE